MENAEVPLCIDLDGTLVRSDVLIEAALACVRHNPVDALRCVGWLMHGRAFLKRRVAEHTYLDVATLPYDARVITWLRRESRQRHCVLCTAADSHVAADVAQHVGGFDEVIASDGMQNLSGVAKAAVLVARFGKGGFDYAGNSPADLHVWRVARRAIVVNASPALVRRVRVECTIERILPREYDGRRAGLRALRPHQWLKNVLLFLPVAAAHMLFSPGSMLRAVVAFVCFCLCASAAYVLNDLLDLSADREHPRKKMRPFASGALSLRWGLVASPALAIAALALACTLSSTFALVLLVYAASTMAYSVTLKRIVILDVLTLAWLYTIRVLAGAVAIPVTASWWLLAFSMFLFVSLAMIKRYAELCDLGKAGLSRTVAGRGYSTDDLALIQMLGTTSGYVSVLVFAFYIDSTASQALYRHHEYLWALAPVLLYWIRRAWLIARRGQMHDDPVVFALTDRASLVVAVVFALVIFAAI